MTSAPRRGRHATTINRSPRRWLATAGLGAIAVTGVTAMALTSAAPAFASSARAAAATSAAVRASHQRGQLVSVTPLRSLPTAAAVRAELTADQFDPSSARYGVRSYRLVYRTVDAHRRPATASGLMVLPDRGARRLSLVSYDHGTAIYRGDAPSESPTGPGSAPAYTFASAGFATAAPDYLGLGTGPGLHPYLDLPSETTATVDLLRAVRQYEAGHGVSLRRDVLATGFSQGGSATLALGRALAHGADPYFRIGAQAPISGPYDLPGAEVPAIVNGDLIRLNPDRAMGEKNTVLYAAYGLVGLNRVHRFYTSPAQIFRAPYASTIETLLDGDHPGDQLLAGTPDRLDQLLTRPGLALFRHPTGALATALRADSRQCDWAPRVPTRLYYATGDEQVVTANTVHCQAAFAAHGATVPAVNLGTPDYAGSRHNGSGAAGTARIVRWFSQLAPASHPR
jgi:hypothetical protein